MEIIPQAAQVTNRATVVSAGTVYLVQVNDWSVYTATDYSRASTIAERLNCIFSDPDRDLDFITPSFASGQYVVCCPVVHRNSGPTYLYDTNSSDGSWQYPENLYETWYWSDPRTIHQTAMLTITGSPTPWLSALQAANRIRYAARLNFPSASGSSALLKLIEPTNRAATARLISTSARCDVYGHPCQGTEPGKFSKCYGDPAFSIVENIYGTCVANGEVLHPCDLTAAMTPTNNWYGASLNKFVRVTNKSNGRSIVVRVTNLAPANKGIELTYRPWVEIGRPLGENSVKIEVMNA